MHSWIQTKLALVASNHYENFSSMEVVQMFFKYIFEKVLKNNPKSLKLLLWLTPRNIIYRAFQEPFSIMMSTADRVLAGLGNDFASVGF